MAAACGQAGPHPPHMYQNGTIQVRDPVTKKMVSVPKMVACGGFEPPPPVEPRRRR